MQISIGKSTKTFTPQEIESLHELSEVITKTNWSCGIFKDDHRNIENFISSDFMALDIDDGVSIEEAARRLKDYSHIIAPSRNHKKEKNGLIADRFRAVVVLDKKIDNKNDYYTTYQKLLELFPEADTACKDPSRLFYPSKEVYNVKTQKERFSVVEYKEPKVEQDVTEFIKRGQLSRPTLDLLQFGAPAGTRHSRLYKAAKDAAENNYSLDDFVDLVKDANNRLNIWNTEEWESDVIVTTKDAFSGQTRYAARTMDDPTFNFMPISDIVNSTKKIDWLVGGLLTTGGISVMSGEAKSGKSTLVRQLAKSVARGETFLKRKVKQGSVLILALEEQAEVLNEQFRALGVSKKDNIMVHVGRIKGEKAIDDLYAACLDFKPNLIIIDTLMLFCQTQNVNDYSEMNKKLEDLRDVARKSGSHIICIHHKNKSKDNYGTGSILGSAAIHGAVDCAIMFNRNGYKRSIQTSQRAGTPFENEELKYIDGTQTYCLGVKMNLENSVDEF